MPQSAIGRQISAFKSQTVFIEDESPESKVSEA